MKKKPQAIEAEKAIKKYFEVLNKLEELHKYFFTSGVIIQEITYFMDYNVNIIIKKDNQNIYKISYNKSFNPELAANIETHLKSIITLLKQNRIKKYTFYYDRYEIY